MNIQIRGYAPIVIDDALLRPDPTATFVAETSYVVRLANELKKPSYLNGRLPAKLTCLEALRAELPRTLSSYAEPMAGVGLSARILGASAAALYLNDTAADCRRVLLENFDTAPTGYDLNDCTFATGELIFLDFNNFTLNKWLRGQWLSVIDYVAASPSAYIIINDCTPFYFRYGIGSFATYSKILDMQISTIEEYFYAAAIEWHARTELYMQAATYFRDSSFQLFGRHPVNEIQIHKVVNPDPIVTAEG